nr:hypothetical protein [Rhizobium sp. Root651]
MAPQDWSSLRLNKKEKDILAQSAHMLRFGDGDGDTTTPIQPAQLLKQRRSGDLGDDLWTTWNVVQENAIKGSIRAYGKGCLGRPPRQVTRRYRYRSGYQAEQSPVASGSQDG